MNDRPLVSIITASYNHAEFIGEAISSVLAQDYPHWELLIADDASTDDSRAVLSAYDDPRIKTFFFDINRQVHMRNFTLEQARGDYIAILNSDDVFLPGKISRQVAYLESHREAAAVFTHVKAIDEVGRTLPAHSLTDNFGVSGRERHGWLRHFFFAGNCLCLPSAMIRCDALKVVGGFDPALVQLADLDLWIRLCLKWELGMLPEVLTAMRVLRKNRNLSARSVATSNRSLLERVRVNRHYLSAEAIAQATSIFPQLEDDMPEATDAWKRFLICQMASGMRNPAMRWFAHQSLQRLISDAGTRASILKKNPRLIRNFILSEGASALFPEAQLIPWDIAILNSEGKCNEDRVQRFWRDFGEQTLSFTVPNPHLEGRIRINPGEGPIGFRLHGMRLFEQQSGKLLWNLNIEQASSEIAVARQVRLTKHGDAWLFRSRGPKSHMRLPMLDLTKVDGDWLDLEIDLAPVKSGRQ